MPQGLHKNSERESVTNIGASIRSARMARGNTIAEMSARLNIRDQYLEAIEAMDAERLPAMAFAMGHIRAYARELGLPGDATVKQFKRQISQEQSEAKPIAKVASAVKSTVAQASEKTTAQVQATSRKVAARKKVAERKYESRQFLQSRRLRLPKGMISGLSLVLVAGVTAIWYGGQAGYQEANATVALLDADEGVISAPRLLPNNMYRLTAIKPSFVEIRTAGGEVLQRSIFTPGQKWEGASDAGFVFSIRDGGALSLERGAQNFGPVAENGTILTMVDLASLEQRLTQKVAIGVQQDLRPK